MDESTADCHQQAVKLFNILHQVAPSSWICEDVIGRGLVADHEVWYYYENLPMQYKEIFSKAKVENFIGKNFYIFNNFAQNIDCGY